MISVSHSLVVPDYSIDPISALARFPASGLSRTFGANVKPTEVPQVVYDGAYTLDAANLRPDGYLPYPPPQSAFAYNGIDSLLLDLQVPPSPGTLGANGALVHLMMLSQAEPYSRAVDAGTATVPVNPFLSTQANTADNALHEVQLEFARLRSEALSPWRTAPVPAPDYHAPSVAASVPPGASLVVEYRGRNAFGGITAWSTGIDFVDGFPQLQYRVTFFADLATGAAPSVDAIVIPVN